MDFILGLPSFDGYAVIMVVIDPFLKQPILDFAVKKLYSMVVELFNTMICKLRSYPRRIISDRDPIYLCKVWKVIFHANATKLRFSTAYHLQSDRQAEALNKYFQYYLRAFVHDKPSTWGKYLYWVEFHYNTLVHSSTGFSPF